MELLFTFFLGAIAAACLVTTLLPFLPGGYGFARIFDFPRIQNAWLAVGGGAAAVLLLPVGPVLWAILAAFGVVLLIQLFFIARFTPLWRRRSHGFRGKIEDAASIRLLSANVKQSNRDYAPLIDLMKTDNPDIAIFIEVDDGWVEALQGATADYPFTMVQAQDNGYGLMVATRFPVSEHRIRFLLNEEVPSFDLTIDHPDGGKFRLVIVHPEPPVAQHDTIGRDAELARVAQIVRQDDAPTIVTGDLNDVAWSRTTRRFLRVSRLLDPREGRGQYNSFDARYWFLRWPLDHIFHTPHFELVSIDRGPKIGSDHFPMLFHLALTDRKAPRRATDEATGTDMAENRDAIETEKGRDRRPVGTDWEDKP